MPFLSEKDNRESMQGLIPAKKFFESEFSEVFAAGVGQVFDEELSISSMLNMEGWNQRKQQVKELGDSGKFNKNEYISFVGEVDYERLSSDFPEFKIKNDRTLFDERSALLKQRREYAQDVFERGSGMAQFLGMATGYMLDPINIATLPIATAGAAAKGLTTLGRALTVARNEAGLAIAAELMIQPLVYQHKHDIGSPFEFSDAITNIAMAATGAAAIGALTGGLSGYFKSVREKAITQPLDNDAIASLQVLARVEDDLNLNPEKINLDLKKVEDDFIQEVRNKLEADVSQKITKSEKKALNSQLNELENRLGKVDIGETVDIRNQIDMIKTRLDADRIGSEASLSLSKINKGIIPDELRKQIDRVKFEKELEVDTNFLRETNNKMETVNPPAKQAENYELPKREPVSRGTINERERAVLERQGIQADYDADIEAFKALEKPRIVQNDEIIDATDFMKSLDDEIAGMDDILRCAIA